MANADQNTVDRIIGRSLIFAETFARTAVRRLVKSLTGRRMDFPEVMARARNLLESFEPQLARAVADSDMASWLFGVSRIVARLTPEAAEAIPGGIITPNVPPLITGLTELPEPVLRFPFLEASIKEIREREIFSREAFDALPDQFKNKAFTVATQSSLDAIDTIRDATAEAIEEGTTLRQFGKTLQEDLEGSKLGRAHMENVFRTNVQASYATGQETIAQQPIFQATLPYARYDAIHDGRVRENHLLLEGLGLDGTNIYRADDPMWRLFTPPWGYQCRCSKTFLTVRQAARKGVSEAKRWLESGVPPTNPEHRLQSIPFRPEDGFVSPGASFAA